MFPRLRRTPLALAAIASVTVLGAFQASPAVRRALSGRIH